MITQLLLMGDYIEPEDLLKGRITEKVNRETIAAAKYSVLKELERRRSAAGNGKRKAGRKGTDKGRKTTE
jgi:hypothetical protein